MKVKRAEELQAEWGSAPCEHPALSRLYDNGERTGDYACTQCGRTLNYRERAELVKGRGTADA